MQHFCSALVCILLQNPAMAFVSQVVLISPLWLVIVCMQLIHRQFSSYIYSYNCGKFIRKLVIQQVYNNTPFSDIPDFCILNSLITVLRRSPSHRSNIPSSPILLPPTSSSTSVQLSVVTVQLAF